MSYNNATHHSEVFQCGYHTDSYHYMSDYYEVDRALMTDESNLWSASSRSSPSPNGNMTNLVTSLPPYPFFPQNTRATPPTDHRQYCTAYQPNAAMTENTANHTPFVRVVKRRTTANKKERRRTQSINNAYADLRDCIPNVPPDTKLSKIKTLRLATSYINYLVKALESDSPAGGFTAELGSITRKSTANLVQVNDCTTGQVSPKSDVSEDMKPRKVKGRTGWPQHVWALELEQDQAL